jgi:NADH-quinone oxidoreductase subunit N
LIGSAATLILSAEFLADPSRRIFEYAILVLLSTLGMMVLISAGDLIMLYLGLELMSLALYVVAASNRDNAKSTEAGLKYFVLGALSSGMLLYGASLVYGFTGTVSFAGIAAAAKTGSIGIVFGLVFLLAGLCFKVSAVPFHMWTPDVYDGAPTPVTGFMAAVAKAGAFAAMLRVLFSSLGVISADWKPIIYALAVLSLVLGSVVALRQRDVKRMLAYSSINHAGFILLGVESALPRGVSASLYYLVAYMFMTIGSFAIVTVLGRKGDGDHDLTRYRGLAQRQPLLALSFAILLLAQAGAPFTIGLWAKLQVVLAAVSGGSVPLAVIAMVTAAIAAFFYLRVAVLMYASSAPGEGGDGAAAPSKRTDGGAQIAWASPDGVSGTITTLNAELLMTDAAVPSTGEETPSVVRVPFLTSVAIGICVTVTVLFGIVPAPCAWPRRW